MAKADAYRVGKYLSKKKKRVRTEVQAKDYRKKEKMNVTINAEAPCYCVSASVSELPKIPSVNNSKIPKEYARKGKGGGPVRKGRKVGVWMVKSPPTRLFQAELDKRLAGVLAKEKVDPKNVSYVQFSIVFYVQKFTFNKRDLSNMVKSAEDVIMPYIGIDDKYNREIFIKKVCIPTEEKERISFSCAVHMKKSCEGVEGCHAEKAMMTYIKALGSDLMI